MSEEILEGLAIIGLHGRFPGAESVEAFWANLVAAKETISFFSDAEMIAAGLDPVAMRKAGQYVPARGVLKDAEYFDAGFFGIHPKEAEVMDPQQRVFLETCWEALERAGYAPDRTPGVVGVFGGATYNTYYMHALHPRAELRELVGREQVMLGNEKDYLTTRVAYKLNLRGPAISLNTACSSSLVAVSQACQSLLTYQCTMALAGGVSVRVPQQEGYFYQEGNIASVDGHTRTFDASAKGTVFSNGVTMVVLKRLADAVADGDQIYAVIKGTAVNNDGSQRVSFGAPGVEGQAEVVALAQEIAGVEADSISYVEAHGTATPIGDPIEVAALTKAFRRSTQRRQFCALGSVKTNIGHLDAAAGTAGLIKVALALKHRQLPASLHFQNANPRLELETSPFFVATALSEWKSPEGVPRRAAISAFGTGGTNAHAVLEEAPADEASVPSRATQLLLLSAKTPDALEAMTRNLAGHLENNPGLNLADVAYTLQAGRSEFTHRRAVVCRDSKEAIALLTTPDPKKNFTAQQTLQEPPVVFMFPGQGAQYVNMGAELYREERIFRENVDLCAAILEPVLGADLRKILFAGAENEAQAEAQLRQTQFTQPALFTIEYALAQLWISWGIKPAAMIGHSVGEYVAGCLAGVFTLEDALTLVARPPALVQAQPPGSMMAVRLSEQELIPLLDPKTAIAAVNAPNLCVISGPHGSIDAFEKVLSAKGIAGKRLHTSHAFHSGMMEPVVAAFTELVRQCPRSEPKIPFVSNVTGRWVTPAEAMSPDYWAQHVRQAVRFADGIVTLAGDPRQILLEVGPGQTLVQLARQHPARKEEQPVISTLGTARDQEPASLLTAAGRLWLAGATISWDGFYTDERRRRVVLPTYPFERKRYWPESLPTAPLQSGTIPTAPCALDSPGVFVEASTAIEVMSASDVPAASLVEAEDAAPNVAPRKDRLLNEARTLLQDLSGTTLEGTDPTTNFLELGLDSLLLTQAAQIFRQKFGVAVSFRQLMEELSSLDAIVAHLDASMPPDVLPAPVRRAARTDVSAPQFAQSPGVGTPDLISAAPAGSLEQLLVQQINLSNQILNVVQRGGNGAIPAAIPALAPSLSTVIRGNAATVSAGTAVSEQKAFGPFRAIETRAAAGTLSAGQQRFLDDLIQRYTARTAKSKAQTQKYRKVLADPRTVAGFRPFWKEMVYPIVIARSHGSRMWDIDGNEYIDYSMGFGTNLLGHSPDFVTAAISEQLGKGVEVGPQTPLAGEVAQLMCELTGMERCAFANTGSEAVLATIRVARTVTGRKRIVYFTGDYHGIFDEVLQRAAGNGPTAKLLPIAPGIPTQSMEYVTILDYDRPESLETIRRLGPEIAAVIVEPVQSRHPDHQPREFLHALRKLTIEIGSALIFDEVITGFRAHPGGVQGLYGIRADLASYGKLIGGGMPIGAICGSARFMDALDGGFWNYGDNSTPEVGVTFFAGTYVRHPLAMAGAWAVLSHLKKEGPALQQGLADRMSAVAKELNTFLRERAVPIHVEQFSSFFWVRYEPALKFASLVNFILRDKGIFIFEGRLFFLATTHTTEDVARLIQTFKEAIVEMQEVGFLPGEPAMPAGNISASAVTSPPTVKAEVVGTTIKESKINSTPALHRAVAVPPPSIDFSVYFFGNYPATYDPEKYRLVLEGAKFADAHGFKAVWLPERHFHAVGGFSPNPSVIAAALARETKQIQLRGGSVVLPLHHPVRVAEEWSMVDNLSGGRAGISIASGWHPNDFVFAPDAFDRRRELCTEGLETIRKLWSGQALSTRTGNGKTVDIKLHPMPAQRELPVWLTCVQTASYEKAGELGVGVLAMLTNQTLDEVAEKIACYRESRARHGYDPATGNVTLLVHTYVDRDHATAVAKARTPMHDYLRSYLGNSQKRHESNQGAGALSLADEDMNYLLERSFNDYLQGKALIGTPETCAAVVEKLRLIGANEIGCFVDFGVDHESVLANLEQLGALKDRCTPVRRDASPRLPGNDASSPPVIIQTEKTIPLTDAQRGLWLLSKLAFEGNQAYMEFLSISIDGPLNPTILRQALQALVDRHEGLRALIGADGQMQTVQSRAEIALPLSDLSSRSGAEKDRKLKEELTRIESIPFDFSSTPTLQANLLRLEENRHLLVLMFHHVFGNGPSYGILFEELWTGYEALSESRLPGFPPAMQLGEYVRWSEEQTASPAFRRDREYWLQQCSKPLPVLDLPTDHQRPPIVSFRGDRYSMEIGQAATAALRKTSGKLRSSLFVTLCSAFNVLLHRLTGQEDIITGVPFEGGVRQLPGGNSLVANTTNMIPVRSRVTWDMPFSEVVAKTKSQVLEANEHQSYFFGHLIRDLALKHDPSRSPVIATSFNLERGTMKKQAAGLQTALVFAGAPFANPRGSAKFELTVNITDTGDTLRLDCDFQTALFEPTTIARWFGHFQTLLASIAADPTLPVSKLSLLNDSERQQILTEWNDTSADYPRDVCMHQLIEAQAACTPDAIAVECGRQRLTYRELDRRSNGLAEELRRNGVVAETPVGIYVDRSVELVVAVLGILKAGGAYVPLDPAFPRERLAFMVTDAQIPVLVTQSGLTGELPEHHASVITVDTVASAEPLNLASGGASSLAYTLYTSGSTGRPKGVQITHGALINFLSSMRREPGLTATDVWLAVTTLSFDIAGLELFLPLITGGQVVMAPREVTLDAVRLAQLIKSSGATIMQATPATWRMLIEAGWAGDPRLKILCGGEAIDRELASRLLDRCGELWNMYGPTETTIWSTVKRLLPDQPITIGRPIANTQVYILDQNLQPTPIGVAGEFFIGGDGVARGYLNRPELTREKFIPNPFDQGEKRRLYRTGDLALFRPDGEVEFIGRADHQVKIRGFRIELGEIESALMTPDAIEQAVVLVREDTPGEKRLVAYLVPAIRENSVALPGSTPLTKPSVAELRAMLRVTLPDYMVPATFVYLDKLPLTPNGKVDRKALLAPDQSAITEAEYEPPQGAIEEKLARIMGSLLGLPKVSRRDGFFDLGGHSLLAVRFFNEIEQSFGKRLPLATLFRAPTVAAIATVLEGESVAVKKWDSLVNIQTGHDGKPRFFCVHGAGGNILLYRDLVSYLGSDYPFYGLQSQGLDKKSAPLTTVEQMAERYCQEIRMLQPTGPYCLGGYCLGGTIAYEMAQRLRREGDEVALLALFDTYNSTGTDDTRPLHYLWQKIVFHTRNLASLSLKDLPGYLSSKARVASDGELRALWKGLTKSLQKDHQQTGTHPAEVNVQEINDAAAASYRPKEYAGRVTVFKPRVNYDFLPDPKMGWGELVTGELNIEELPINPHAMLVAPFVQDLAVALRKKIDLVASQKPNS